MNYLQATTKRKLLNLKDLQPGNGGGTPKPELVSKPSLEEVMQ
jgi:hypothetical protein